MCIQFVTNVHGSVCFPCLRDGIVAFLTEPVRGQVDTREGLADSNALSNGLRESWCLSSITEGNVFAQVDTREGLAHGYGRAECFCSFWTEIVAPEIDFREGLADRDALGDGLAALRAEIVIGKIDRRERLAHGY